MNRQILHIALPSIVSNITVPLLALVDTTIAGHLGAASYIGSIAVGGLLFNMVYWLFGFLRMATGGLTAQSYGAGRKTECQAVLLRSLLLAAALSLLLVAGQKLWLRLSLHWIQATPEVIAGANRYFDILVWGAPAVLGLYSLTGWFLGMQNARYPMWIAIGQNVTNIALSALFVFGFGMKIEGVALGSLIAQWAGFLIALLLAQRMMPWPLRSLRSRVFDRAAFRRFFQVGRDIFLRTLCLIAVTTAFTAAGAASGDLTLAANTLLMQFFILFSYVMDGFAYAGEALGGRYFGAADQSAFVRLTRNLAGWGLGLATLFTLLYVGLGDWILRLLTNEARVIAVATAYLPAAYLIPLVGVWAFLFDGLLIGTTSTRPMLLSMAFATATFFLLHTVLPLGNANLWLAFLTYLGSRGAAEALLFRKVIRKIPSPSK